MDAARCLECDAPVPEGKSCRDYFDRMLEWDFQDFRGAGREHHLTVLCYCLQHPASYSARGLQDATGFLVEIIERGFSNDEQYRRNKEVLASDVRDWKIAASAGDRGAYAHAPAWSMTAADVAGPGLEGYPERVRAWGTSILRDLRASGNLPAA